MLPRSAHRFIRTSTPAEGEDYVAAVALRRAFNGSRITSANPIDALAAAPYQ